MFDLCVAGFVCESTHSLINLLKCYIQRKCIMFVNTCICLIDSSLTHARTRAHAHTHTHTHAHARTYTTINVHTHSLKSFHGQVHPRNNSKNTHAHTHARDIISNSCILFIYYLSHVVRFTSCSCVLLCVCILLFNSPI